jgi:hypothetical protein
MLKLFFFSKVPTVYFDGTDVGTHHIYTDVNFLCFQISSRIISVLRRQPLRRPCIVSLSAVPASSASPRPCVVSLSAALRRQPLRGPASSASPRPCVVSLSAALRRQPLRGPASSASPRPCVVSFSKRQCHVGNILDINSIRT